MTTNISWLTHKNLIADTMTSPAGVWHIRGADKAKAFGLTDEDVRGYALAKGLHQAFPLGNV